jgi:hypothetical protein
MLIFGLNKSKIATEGIQGNCVHCRTRFSIDAVVHGRYFHLFYIPVFPVGKQVSTLCSHCKQSLEGNEAREIYGSDLQEVKRRARAPLWHYSWLFIWLTITPFFIYFENKTKEKDLIYITEPYDGDIYEIKTGLWSYTLYKVAESKPDSIFFYPNKYTVIKKRKLEDEKMLKPESFDLATRIAFSKSDLKEMRENKEVLGIQRSN